MNKKEKFRMLEEYINNLYGEQKTFLNYEKDYELLIAIILSAQSKDEVVNRVTKVLFEKYQSLESLKNASYDDIYDIIHDVGLAKNKSKFVVDCAKMLVDNYNGVIPLDRKELTKLPGVGNKVSGVFLGELYNYKLLPVDTHINRICKKLDLVRQDATTDEIEKTLMKLVSNPNPIQTHKQLISFGRNICIANNRAKCYLCPLEKVCKNKNKKIK